MLPKTDNHKIYDDDIKKAELGNKQAIDKDTLSDKETELIDGQDSEKKGIGSFVENAKLIVTKNPKKSAGLGFGLFGILSVIYLGVLSLGPLEVINLSENLKQTFFSDHEEASANKTTKLIFYAKSGGDYTTTRLGVLGNLYSKKIDNNLAKKGVFIKNNGGNKFRYVFDATKGDNPVSEKEAKKQAQELQKAAEREGIKSGKLEGHTYVIESEGKIFTSYKFINKYVLGNTLDVGKVQTALATRTINKKTAAGKWNVFAKIDGKVNEKRNAVLKKLSEQLTGKRNTASAEGVKAEENATPEEKAAAESTSQTADEGNTAKSELKEGKSTASKFLGPGKVAAGVSGAGLGLVCMLKAGVDDVDSANRKTAKMNTIRAFQKTVPLGDEAKSGEPNTINYQGLGEVVKLLRTDPEYKKEAQAQGIPVYESSSLQNYETTKNTNNIDTSGAKLPDEARQDLANSDIGNFLNNIKGLDGICKVVNSAVVVIISAVSAPFTTAATALITPVLMNTITNYFKDDAIDWTEKQYRGGPFKEAVYAGGREYSNQLWYQDGGRALTDNEIAQEHELDKQKYIAENRSKSIFEKYFNVYDSQTPVNKFALSLQKSPISNEPSTIVSNFSQIINIKLFPRAKAAKDVNDTEMYYGTRKAKLTTMFINRYQQPYETADKANTIIRSPGGEKYIDIVKKCYGYEVDISGNVLDFKSINGTSEDPLLIDPESKDYPKECNNDNDENLNIIRDALNSTNNMKRYVCAEFDDPDSCDEILPEDSSNQSGDVGEGGAFIQGDYAWPVGIFKKDLGSPSMPCPTTPPYCHHDDSPAFDLSTKNTKEAENMPVYAITDGKMWLTKNHGGVENCYNFHILGDDGYDYFYGHTKNPILKNSSATKRVKKGDKVAEIGSLACGDNTINHLHLDQSKEYGHAVSSRTENLIKIMNDLYENLPDTAPESSESQTTSSSGWQWPVRKSDFSGEIKNCWRKPGHTGIDLGVGVGTPIYAAKAGTVVESGDGGDAGNYVMIKHEGGNWSNYQHLSSIIRKSGKVEAGELIGKSGNTGYSSGPHLHFSITDAQTLSSRTTGTNTLNPLDFLPKDGPGKVLCN